MRSKPYIDRDGPGCPTERENKMPKQIIVQYGQSIAVDVEEGDSVEYLEFVITECEEAPELIDEFLD